MSTALANLDPEPLIAQIANGAYLRDIAKQTGIDKRRLSEVLRKHPDYALAKECSIEVQLENADEALRDPATDIARAREQWRYVAWRAERECPHRWGQRTQVSMDVTLDLGPSLRDALARAGRADSLRDVSSSPVQHVISSPKTDYT